MPKRVTACFVGLLALAIFAILSTGTSTATAANVSAPPRDTGGQRFLTLPFTDPRIIINGAWLYQGGGFHGGIDYILGSNNNANWQSFDVVAAADGWACGNCTSREGNAVWIRHLVNGITYYTYYGHLASIESNIPIGSQQDTVWVQRGQKLGVSGNTGADVIHLHFQVALANSAPVDPYDLWTTREPYSPGCTQCRMGPNMLWTTNPPSMANGAPPPPAATAPAATPTVPPPTSTPTPSPTPVSRNLVFGKVVSGSISNAAPSQTYFIDGMAGEWVSIRMFASNDATLDTFMKLYSPNDVLIAFDDDGAQIGSNSFMVKQLPMDGTYKLEATRYSGVGSFHLRMDKGADSALGDMNGDCQVDSADLAIMQTDMQMGNLAGDLNLDGAVDNQDLGILQYRLGRGCMFLKP